MIEKPQWAYSSSRFQKLCIFSWQIKITYLTITFRKWWDICSLIFRISQVRSAFLQAFVTFHGTEISTPVTKCLFSACSRDIKNVPSNVLQKNVRFIDHHIEFTQETNIANMHMKERTDTSMRNDCQHTMYI